jgi:hypothetical protein
MENVSPHIDCLKQALGNMYVPAHTERVGGVKAFTISPSTFLLNRDARMLFCQ